MLEEITDLCWDRSICVVPTHHILGLVCPNTLYVLTRGSFLGPPLLRASFEGVDENADVCWTMAETEGFCTGERMAWLARRRHLNVFIAGLMT